MTGKWSLKLPNDAQWWSQICNFMLFPETLASFFVTAAIGTACATTFFSLLSQFPGRY